MPSELVTLTYTKITNALMDKGSSFITGLNLISTKTVYRNEFLLKLFFWQLCSHLHIRITLINHENRID